MPGSRTGAGYGREGYETRLDAPVRRALFDVRRRISDIAGPGLGGRAGGDPGLWNDLRVPLSATNQGPVKAPTFTQWRDDGAGSTGLFGYSFSASSEEEVFFDAQLPHQYVEGTRIGPHCHFSPVINPTDGQTVRLGLEYSWSNVNGVFPTTTTIYAEVTFASNVAYEQLIGGFDPDIDEPTMKVSAMIGGRLFRDATHPNDTFTGEVVIHEIDFHYLAESLGSTNEFSK